MSACHFKAACMAVFILSSAAVLGVPGSQAADPFPEPRSFNGGLFQAWRDCTPDRDRFCATVPVGGGRVVRCLMEHRDRLSPRCQRHTQTVDVVGDAAEACAPDTRNFCENVLPGGGRIVSCLSGNRDRVSRRCRQALDDARSALRY